MKTKNKNLPKPFSTERSKTIYFLNIHRTENTIPHASLYIGRAPSCNTEIRKTVRERNGIVCQAAKCNDIKKTWSSSRIMLHGAVLEWICNKDQFLIKYKMCWLSAGRKTSLVLQDNEYFFTFLWGTLDRTVSWRMHGDSKRALCHVVESGIIVHTS
jgi:hypothetical protein